MTKFQKAFCVALSLCFAAVLTFLEGQPLLRGNLFGQLPLYCFLEEKARRIPPGEDPETSEKIMEVNGRYLSAQVKEENQEKKEEMAKKENQKEQAEKKKEKKKKEKKKKEKKNQKIQDKPIGVTPVKPSPKVDLSMEALANYEYLLGQFFILDPNTATNPQQLNAAEFLAKDLTVEKKKKGPQILIYHSHSQETFIDSREGRKEDTIVGVGDYLTKLLRETYGYQVLHVKKTFDLVDGVLDRSRAYDLARIYVEKVLEKNPEIEVIIDLHRDGVPEDRHLVTEINGKPTAQIMFYNGLSYTVSNGVVEDLPNPYIQDNLAFSFQLEYEAAQYYPDFYRGIYLAGLRYNLHLRPRTILLEAGAQTNTVQEVKNAMEPFADILNRVLSEKKQGRAEF